MLLPKYKNHQCFITGLDINFYQTKDRKKWVLLPIFVFIIVLPTFPMLSMTKNKQNNITLVSPLAEKTTINTPTTGVKRVYTLEYYLSLSNSFVQKATRLANDDPYQTEEEKLIIINALNQALKTAKDAVAYYPQSPDAYFSRAQIYQKIQHLYPETKLAAENDLAKAQQLLSQNRSNNTQNSGWQSTDVSAKNNPLDFIPAQKASLSQSITIAAPGENTLPENNQTELNTNALAGEAILPAGKNEIKIYSPQLRDSSTVYLVPEDKSANITLTVSAKKSRAWFNVQADSAPNSDLKFKWWIITDENQKENEELSTEPNPKLISDLKTVS